LSVARSLLRPKKKPRKREAMQAKGRHALTMHLSQHINREAARRSLQNAFAPRALLRAKERCTSACTH